MTYAKSLRVIGQSLEVARVTTFELEKDGQDYLVRSESLTQTGDWILRNAISESDFTQQSGRRSSVHSPLRFTPLDISRLDSYRQKQRRSHSSSQTQGSSKLSQLLRSLGDHLDRTEVSSFHILWTPDSVSVDYQESDGQSDSRTFTAEKLQQLGLHIRFRRSNRSAWTTSVIGAGRLIR
jgi:hypothetical protein